MASFDVQWDGLEEMKSTLVMAMAQSETQVGNVIYNNVEEMGAKARGFAPVDTGFLKTSIESSRPSLLSGEVNSAAGYAGFQEFGTRYQPGTPHIRPAFDSQIPTLEKQIRDVAKGMFK